MSDIQINVVKGNISLNNKNVKGKLTMPEKTKAYINYEDDHELYNRPRINDVELIGNKLSEDLGLEPTIHDITEQDIDNLIYGG